MSLIRRIAHFCALLFMVVVTLTFVPLGFLWHFIAIGFNAGDGMAEGLEDWERRQRKR